MADYATKQDVQEIVDKAVTKAVEDLSDVIAQFATNVDARFDKVETILLISIQNTTDFWTQWMHS